MPEQRVRNTIVDNVHYFSERISKLTESPQENEIDVRKLYSPSLELEEACYHYCYNYGLAQLTGVVPLQSVTNPHIVRVAIPAAIDRLNALDTTNGPVSDLLHCIETSYVAQRCHTALHDGYLVDSMGPMVGLSWGPKFFCPAFHELEMVVQDMNNNLTKESGLVTSCSRHATSFHTLNSFFTLCGKAFKEINSSIPWWFIQNG